MQIKISKEKWQKVKEQAKYGQRWARVQTYLLQKKWRVFSKEHISRPMGIMLVSMGILFGLIFGFQIIKNLFIKHAMLSGTEPPVSVSSIKVEYKDWQSEIKTVGSLRAVQGVDVTTEIAGMVRQIDFIPGAEINAGETLIILNNATETANVQALEASVELAKIVLKRDTAQYAIKAVSKATLDADTADLQNKEAQLEAQKATLLKKTIRAPFAGRLGIRNINLGQYLNPGDKISTLQALDPIYVDFSLPQQILTALKVGQSVKMLIDTFPKEIFEGKITTIDPKVDPNTRNIQLEATILNPKHLLLPGMFANTTVIAEEVKRYLTLPQAAISYNPYGEIVYVIQTKNGKKKAESELVVTQTFVKVGEARGDQVVILEGVKEGDWVVTSGQLKLRNGSRVVINNTVVPSNNPHPRPKNE